MQECDEAEEHGPPALKDFSEVLTRDPALQVHIKLAHYVAVGIEKCLAEALLAVPLIDRFQRPLNRKTGAELGKMQEYLANGVQLGWLIDPNQRRVHIYRLQVPVEILENPDMLSAGPVLLGFVLDLREAWGPKD